MDFKMNHGSERIQAFVVIVIASFLIIYPAYFQYNELIEIDFLSPSPNFENLDQENFLGDEQNRTKIFVIGFSPEIYLFGFFCPGQLPRLSYEIISLDHPISILRC
jgi:hypothetical protein